MQTIYVRHFGNISVGGGRNEISYTCSAGCGGLNMLMFASRIVDSSEVKLCQQREVSRSSYSRGCVLIAVSTGLCIVALAAVSTTMQ